LASDWRQEVAFEADQAPHALLSGRRDAIRLRLARRIVGAE
jgi:hypothetical protein